jgi:DNA-binding NtrC family response regulator
MKYRNLILVEDDQDDQELFLQALENISTEISCVVFDNASEALRQIKDRSVACDMLFLDLNMPMITGTEFLEELTRSNAGHPPVVILSSSSYPPVVADATRLGAVGFYTKPSSFHELEKLLETILHTDY